MSSKRCLVRYKKMARFKTIKFDDDENYFGHCPVSEHENYYLNIGRAHWMVYQKCRIKWFMGENLFSFWRSENEETWKANAETIKGYEELDF